MGISPAAYEKRVQNMSPFLKQFQLYSIGHTFCEGPILVGGFNRISDNRARVLKAQKSAAKPLTGHWRAAYKFIPKKCSILFYFILKMFAV